MATSDDPPARRPSRRWIRALGLGSLALVLLIGVGVAFGALQPTKERREVVARLRVAAHKPKILFDVVTTSQAESDFPHYLNFLKAMAKSQLVLGTALNNVRAERLDVLKDQDDPIDYLRERLIVEGDPESEILSFRFRDAEPAVQAVVINAVVDAFLSEVVDAERQQAKERLENLKAIYRDYQQKLAEHRATLRKLSEHLGSTHHSKVGELSQQLGEENALRAGRELFQVRYEKVEVEAGLAWLKAHENKPEQEVEDLRKRLAILEAQEKYLVEFQEQLRAETQEINVGSIDLETIKANIRQMEEAAQKVGREVEALGVELHAPLRIQIIEKANANP